jgi:hypothetical protein
MHEIELSWPPAVAVVVQVGLAAVGLVVVRTLPERSAAAQNAVDGHETSSMLLVPSMLEGFQVTLGEVGLLVISALPESSTATHREVLGQEIDWMRREVSTS